MEFIFIVVITWLVFLTLKLYNMPTKQEFQDALNRQSTAISNIAADITRLTQQLGTGGLSESDEADILAQLQERAAALESIAAITPEPETPPTPEA